MLSFISLSYHIQHSSNLYNKAYFDTTPYQLNRESSYKMETFCMVVFGGEYVTTYCWRPGVAYFFYSLRQAHFIHYTITLLVERFLYFFWQFFPPSSFPPVFLLNSLSGNSDGRMVNQWDPCHLKIRRGFVESTLCFLPSLSSVLFDSCLSEMLVTTKTRHCKFVTNDCDHLQMVQNIFNTNYESCSFIL